MKQLVWSPSSINFGSKKKGESATAESTLSITEGSALLTPGKISPLPGADYPVQIKNTEGNLHIHPAFIFAAARYYLTSAGVLTTNRDIAELYLGNAGAGSGLPFLPVPLTLVITTPPGEFEPEDPLTINYTSSAVLWVKVFFKVNDSEWFFYDIFNATGTFDMDISEWGFSHGDILTIKVQDDESTSFYDTVDLTAMVKNIVIDSIGTLYLIGEFEDGVDYYATPEGDITTDITGIYLGVGNSDGDIDLDIIEYEMTMTYPAGSEEIGLDIPFDVTAATNLQDGREVLIYAKKEGVTEHIGTATVSGGAISESVSIPSSAFTAEDTVTIELNYASGAVTDSNDVTTKTATITNVTSTPASPTEATNFELSGESTYLVGEELTLQYSTDDSTWLPLGVATVQPDGTWSKADCQIADAGTYYLRAIYGAKVVESASISVVVASGVVLTALQITNASDAVSPATIRICDTVIDGDYTYILLQTTSDKITINGVTCSNPNSKSSVLVKIETNTQDVHYVSFFAIENSGTIQRQMYIYGDYIYITSYISASSNYVGKVTKITKSNGSSYANWSPSGKSRFFGCCGIGNTLYVYGTWAQSGYPGDQYIWDLSLDTFTENTRTYIAGGDAIGAGLTLLSSDMIAIYSGYYSVGKYIPSTKTYSANVYGIAKQFSNYGTSLSEDCTKLMIQTVSGTDLVLRRQSINSPYIASYNQVVQGGFAVSHLGSILADNDNNCFYHYYNDASNIYVDVIDDSDVYNRQSQKTMTPYSSVFLLHNIIDCGAYVCITGSIRGSMESGFVPGDETQYDAFVKLVEK